MFSSIINKIKRHILNLPGWRTDRKIIVIESDDWGMVRMASKDAYNWFLQKGYRVDQCPYNKYDALECNSDLEFLFDVLNSVEDKNGNSPVITANNIVANPNFEKIKDSNFSEYYYESFTKTLEKYPERDRVLELYKEGISRNIFFPQFHGREHLNVNRWMSELNSENRVLLEAFQQNMFTIYKSGKNDCYRHNLDAFGMRYEKEWVNIKDIIVTGLNLFEEIWDYRSLSFIAPCYTWPVEIENILYENGVKYLQGTSVQRIPISKNKPNINKKYHYNSQTNHLGQRYLVRNVGFEPTLNNTNDPVSKAMNEIKMAFKYKKPAVISCHRVNFMGSLRSKNRYENLRQFKILLNEIKNKWPSVEFMTTCELAYLIENHNNQE